MHRQPSCCDFCGLPQVSQEYLTDREGIKWYACLECAGMVDAENWNRLIERSLAAYAQIRPIPDGEEPALRKQVERLVKNFRLVRLVAV